MAKNVICEVTVTSTFSLHQILIGSAFSHSEHFYQI